MKVVEILNLWLFLAEYNFYGFLTNSVLYSFVCLFSDATHHWPWRATSK